MFTNYYKLLNLDKNCSKQEIKRAFRKKIKSIHPDLKLSQEDENLKKNTQILIKAYNVLIDDKSKRNYDKILEYQKSDFSKNFFDYRKFLLNQKTSFAYAKLIMFELYSDNDNYALKIYFKHPKCLVFLEKDDMLDCFFMLAEECIKQKKFIHAFDLLYDITKYEVKNPYFKMFFSVVIDLLKLCVKNIILIYDFECSFEKIYLIVSSELCKQHKEFFIKKGIKLCQDNNEYTKLSHLNNELTRS